MTKKKYLLAESRRNEEDFTDLSSSTGNAERQGEEGVWEDRCGSPVLVEKEKGINGEKRRRTGIRGWR